MVAKVYAPKGRTKAEWQIEYANISKKLYILAQLRSSSGFDDRAGVK